MSNSFVLGLSYMSIATICMLIGFKSYLKENTN